MSTEMMLALGDYRFSVATAAYQSLKRTTEYRWAAQQRQGRRPAQQFIGVGRDEISLQGMIYPHYSGGLGQLDTMRAEAGKGLPLMLVDGQGGVHGKWCITRVEEGQKQFFAGGLPRQQTFALALTHYGEDDA